MRALGYSDRRKEKRVRNILRKAGMEVVGRDECINQDVVNVHVAYGLQRLVGFTPVPVTRFEFEQSSPRALAHLLGYRYKRLHSGLAR